jgi:hypothetical protein
MKVLALFQKATSPKSGKIRKFLFSSFSKFSTAVSLDDDFAFSDSDYETLHNRISSVLPALPENSRRIYLLRHGETNWNAEGKIQGGGFDIPLNEKGRAQAMAATKNLPKNTDLSIKRKVEQKKVEKKVEEKVEEKEEKKKDKKDRKKDKKDKKK